MGSINHSQMGAFLLFKPNSSSILQGLCRWEPNGKPQQNAAQPPCRLMKGDHPDGRSFRKRWRWSSMEPRVTTSSWSNLGSNLKTMPNSRINDMIFSHIFHQHCSIFPKIGSHNLCQWSNHCTRMFFTGPIFTNQIAPEFGQSCGFPWC